MRGMWVRSAPKAGTARPRAPLRENGSMSKGPAKTAKKTTPKAKPDLIGVVDTMFARYDMGGEALDALKQQPGHGTRFRVLRRTVPGFKDLAVEAKRMIEEEGCRIIVALGMPGSAEVDKVCAHEASTGLMSAQLMTNTHILEVFVHEDESDDPAVLATVFKNRSRDHAINAYQMLYDPDALVARAGQGIRQGFGDAGPLAV